MSEPGNVLLDVKHLKKYFAVTAGLMRKTVGWVKAVDDISFFINQGEKKTVPRYVSPTTRL